VRKIGLDRAAQPVLEKLRKVHLNRLTPLEALNLLAELKKVTAEPRRARGKANGSPKVEATENIPPFPRIKKRDIERRTVIEAYASYDCSMNNRPRPAFATWDWSQADAIDKEMCRAQLKIGVPAGYLLWDEIEVTMSVLRECGVHDKIFPGKPRSLGLLASAGELVGWKPDRKTIWYEGISKGQTFDGTAPMLLRPAVRGESPARWYVEDGSGRATAFIANQQIFDPSRTLAIGYLGRKPDPNSSFMRDKFWELLERCAT
jgi:hypothetical protein